MKRWITVVCVAALSGCTEPHVSVTDASPRRIGFLVENAELMSMPDLGEQAASHCQRHGLSYRLTDDAWIGPTLRRIIYECGKAEQPLPHKMTVHHARP